MSTYIGSNAKVSDSAQVYGWALVSGSAQVCDSARVSGSARVYGSARVSGSAQVCGWARVYGSAVVCGKAKIAKTRDHIVLGPSIGESQRYITAHRDSGIGIRVNTGCFSGSISEFRAAVAKTHAENFVQRTQYELFADLIEAHFALADLMDLEESQGGAA